MLKHDGDRVGFWAALQLNAALRDIFEGSLSFHPNITISNSSTYRPPFPHPASRNPMPGAIYILLCSFDENHHIFQLVNTLTTVRSRRTISIEELEGNDN